MVTSEDPSFPIEYAFGSNDGPGWRASEGGEQQIRLLSARFCAIRPVGQARRLRRTLSPPMRGWEPREGCEPAPLWAASERVGAQSLMTQCIAIRPDLRRPEAVASLASLRLG